MLARFVAWLDDLLAEEGGLVVVKAVLGIMSFAVLLGAVLGNTAVKAGALVSALLVLLSLGLLLLADRRTTLRRLDVHRQLVSHYTKIGLGGGPPAYRVVDWDESVAVAPNGDARKRVMIRAEVLADDLWAVRLVHGCGWDQPARYRRRVRVVARKLLTDDAPGPKMAVTSAWLGDGKFVLIIHFRVTPPKGSEFGVLVECDWPGMCAPLMQDRSPDEFTLNFVTPVAHARYRVALPSGYDAYFEPVGFEAGEAGFASNRSVNENGQVLFGMESSDVPSHRAVGMRLEVKGRGVLR